MLQSIGKRAEDNSHIAWHLHTILERTLVEELLKRFVEGNLSSNLLDVFQAHFNHQFRRWVGRNVSHVGSLCEKSVNKAED